jgi:hypothetical protein
MAKITKAMLASVIAIASAPNGLLMLTQAEGADIVNAGLAVVDTANVEGDKAAVLLTEEGSKVAAENGAGAPASSGTATYEIEDGVAMPTSAARKGREGIYPFNKLEIGQSFHVAKTAENLDPASRLASSVSGARLRFSEETGETETVEVKKYQRGETGTGYAKDADGKRIVASTETVTRPKLRMTRDFAVKSVGADDPKGEGARVWRIALPNG